MAHPINPNATEEYVLKADRDLPPEEQSVFILGYLTLDEMGAVDDTHLSFEITREETGQTGHVNSGTQANLLLKYGLRGWRNFPPGSEDNHGFALAKDTQTRAGQVRREVPTSKTISQIHPRDRREIAQRIAEISGLREEERGNSPSSPQPSVDDSTPTVGDACAARASVPNGGVTHPLRLLSDGPPADDAGA